jgi:hypothetical protein
MESLTLVTVLGGLVALAMVCLVALRGWSLWLALKHRELDLAGAGDRTPLPSPAARIELADLKERIRKLEAIAAGVDL